LFLKKYKGYEKYARLSRIIMNMSMISLLFLLILKLLFGWGFLDYIVNVLLATFILSLFIDAIPDFLENNIKALVWDLIFITLMIWVLFFW
jgi:K+-transporting ATPase A subunit